MKKIVEITDSTGFLCTNELNLRLSYLYTNVSLTMHHLILLNSSFHINPAAVDSVPALTPDYLQDQKLVCVSPIKDFMLPLRNFGTIFLVMFVTLLHLVNSKVVLRHTCFNILLFVSCIFRCCTAL